jgi:uncharacterized protein YegJ (DUF2314 family)
MNRSVGNLINVLCQAMAEGATVNKPGEYDLNLRLVKNTEVRDPQVNSLGANATGVALLALRKGKPDAGDPGNRLIEIAFDRYPGRDVHSKQVAMLSSLFGSEERVSTIKHDERILAASRNARQKLPSLRDAFATGLQPGEHILVKVPFATPDGGYEWMWVEITAWQGTKIRGLLANNPSSIPTLHAGENVEVNQDEVFDYIRQYPDGRQEGNETAALIEKQEQQKGN